MSVPLGIRPWDLFAAGDLVELLFRQLGRCLDLLVVLLYHDLFLSYPAPPPRRGRRAARSVPRMCCRRDLLFHRWLARKKSIPLGIRPRALGVAAGDLVELLLRKLALGLGPLSVLLGHEVALSFPAPPPDWGRRAARSIPHVRCRGGLLRHQWLVRGL